ncbi:MAG: RNA polymerase sigma-70 factor (ECF subfamily) [Candidatus Azotimanducaceae bacterium]|jgi:RNA polymerase sigma-70 factor (ECF subfamily)
MIEIDEQIELLVRQAQLELPYRKVAFEQLAELLYPGVRRLATGVTGNQAFADSATQDVLLRALHGLPKLKQTDSFPFWLRRITINVCNSAMTKEKREREKLEAYSSQADLSDTPEGDSPSYNQMVAGLNIEERTIVSLKILEDLEFQEIARVVDQTVSATKMRYYRALDKMKTQLE